MKPYLISFALISTVTALTAIVAGTPQASSVYFAPVAYHDAASCESATTKQGAQVCASKAVQP